MKGKNTQLLFCTSGILLRRLLSDRNLNGITHVFVDEIHERGMNEGAILLDSVLCVFTLEKPSSVILNIVCCPFGKFSRFSTYCVEGSSSTSPRFEINFNECHFEC